MQASFPSLATAQPSNSIFLSNSGFRLCGLRTEVINYCSASSQFLSGESRRIRFASKKFGYRRSITLSASAAASTAANGSPKNAVFDYDLVIIGAGVGGHGAALHTVEKGHKTAIIEGDAMGGTCVNRGCVPSKALLAVSGRMRELQDEQHLKALGLPLLYLY